MSTTRVSALTAAMLVAAAVSTPVAMASDQLGTTADQWKEEHTNTEFKPDGITPSNGGVDSGRFLTNLNSTRGDGPLNRITGVLTPGNVANTNQFLDADIFCINITNPAAFSAVTNGTGDRTLSLFDLAGHGIAFNDNRTDSATSQGAMLTSALTSSLQPGLYLLAVSLNDVTFDSGAGANRRFLTRPLDANGNLMFPGPANAGLDDATLGGYNDQRRVEVGPINPTAVLAGWEEQSGSRPSPFTSSYTLTLTGSGYHQLPAPGAAAMLGLGGLLALRRKRS